MDTTAEKKVTTNTPVNTKTKTTKPKVSPPDSGREQPGDTEGDTPQVERGIMTLGADGEADSVYEGTTEEAMITFKMTRPGTGSNEEVTEIATEEANEEETINEMVTEATGEEATETATEEETEEKAEETAQNFSYMYDKSVYKEGEAGVVTEGFVNTEPSPITNSLDAIARAKNECTVEYTRTTVFRDSIEDMWMVNFGTDVPGGDQSVYMTGDGVTTLIVYGE